MRNLFLLLPLLLLASCEVAPPTGGPPINFRRYQPIYINVQKIDVVEEYKSPNRAPNIEHLMPYSPADAMQIWTKDRLRASGGDKTMQVIVKDASVIEKDLPGSGGVLGVFGVNNDKQYDARLEVELRIYGDAALSEASVNVIANRSMTMNASSGARTRDQQFRRMINEMMDVTNAELEKNIFQHLGGYVNYSMNP